MFRENEEFSAKVDSLVALCATKRRGDILGHEEISLVLKCLPYRGCWNQAVDKAKRRFEREHGITLWSVREVGYKLLTEAEQLDLAPRKRIKRAGRQIGKAIKHVEAPIEGELEEHLLRKRAFVREALHRRKSELHGESIRQGIFAKRNEPPPARIPFT